MIRSFALTLSMVGLLAPTAHASPRTKLAREAAEYVIAKFGGKAAQEGAEALSARIASAAARHGDEAFAAVRRVGPKALTLADEAGTHGPKALALLSRHGDDAAIWVIQRPKGLSMVSRFGDDAAEALIKHKGLAEPVIEQAGGPAVKAMVAVGPQNGRRMAMMAQGGELTAIGRTPELMGVVSRHGDRAMDFIWRNKGPLAVGATLAAFLANPEPFINGTAQLAGTAAEHVVKPVVQETAHTLSDLVWAVVVALVALLAVGSLLSWKYPRLGAAFVRLLLSLRRKK